MSARSASSDQENTPVTNFSSLRSHEPRRGRSQRFRGLTCANCRIRKVRCEGSQPTCKTCEVYGDKCRYDKAPPLSQIVALARRLQDAEVTIARLQGDSIEPGHSIPAATSAKESSGTLSRAENSSPANHAQGTSGRAEDGRGGHGQNASISVHAPAVGEVVSMDITPKTNSSLLSTSQRAAEDPTIESTAINLSVDEHGKICYYGPTSAVHDPPTIGRDASSTSVYGQSSSTTDFRSYLSSQAEESALWEPFALENAALRTGIPRQVMTRLLELHFTWVAPMFMWIYRPAFMRDMTTGGPYYSDFLLTVVCAHSSKYHDGQYSELLFSRVRHLLGEAVQQPSSIPTVQALMQHSAREIAQGCISQAWVYSGIAFRMATDLGLQHHDSVISSLKGLTPVDLEIRRRLYWSCYFWDKAISMYTGRLPSLTELPRSSMEFMDDSADTETWWPFNGDTFSLTKLPPSQYPPMRSYALSCFANSCKLAVIINDIIIQLYTKRGRQENNDALRDIEARLEAWRAESPSHLKVDPTNLPPISPPPHIISQNLLYHTTVILAYRPLWSNQAFYNACISAAKNMEKLLLLLEATFGFENITYLMGYCIYTGASAILEDAKKNNDSANATMQTFLRALNMGMKRCPLLERSLNIIIKGLKRRDPPPPRADLGNQNSGSDAAPQVAPSMVNSYIPAFPYLDAISPDTVNNSFPMDASMDPIDLLDCFPELQPNWGNYQYLTPL